jgi:hypothetical protein
MIVAEHGKTAHIMNHHGSVWSLKRDSAYATNVHLSTPDITPEEFFDEMPPNLLEGYSSKYFKKTFDMAKDAYLKSKGQPLLPCAHRLLLIC